MEADTTREDDIYSEEYKMEGSTKPSDLPDEDIKDETNAIIIGMAAKNLNCFIFD